MPQPVRQGLEPGRRQLLLLLGPTVASDKTTNSPLVAASECGMPLGGSPGMAIVTHPLNH